MNQSTQKGNVLRGESQSLLTSVDLPIVSQIVEASAEAPCLAMSLKLEMSLIRELLSREEIHVAGVCPDSPAMVTSAATVEFLSACCRLMDPGVTVIAQGRKPVDLGRTTFTYGW